MDYDSLLVACGAETSYFGNDQWRDVSFGLKTLPDAVALRNRIYGAFEEAERASDPREREQWLTFVVIGGGPTGVELAGELAIITRHTMKGYFSRIQPAQAKVILLDAGSRLVSAFSERLSGKVAEQLSSLGVEVREGARVTAIDEHGVTAQIDGAPQQIAARTVVWAAGVQAVGFCKTLAQATGAQADRAGRVQIEPDLTLAGHREISAIGDITQLEGPGERPLPGLATVSIQQARHVARAIRARRAERQHAVSLSRQGRDRGRRARQGCLRNTRSRTVGPPRFLHVPDGPHVLPHRRRSRTSPEGADRLDQHARRRAAGPGDRRRPRQRRAPAAE